VIFPLFHLCVASIFVQTVSDLKTPSQKQAGSEPAGLHSKLVELKQELITLDKVRNM